MENKKELLINYIKANVAPILTNLLTKNDLPNLIIIPSDISINNLTGYFDGVIFKIPSWYENIISNKNKILVIDNIDAISKSEQQKFIEILKYKKVGTLNLPDDTVIILTATNINKDTINEVIYSLCAHI